MNWHFEQKVDLQRPSDVLSYPDLMMAQGDHLAHTWRVQVYSGGRPMDLTGYVVTAYFDRSDGKMVPVMGSAVGHVASVVLPQSVYVAAGRLTGLLRAGKDGQIITLAAGRWNVLRGPGDEIVDPGHVVPTVEELLARIAEMEAQTQAASTAANKANTAADTANDAADKANNAASHAETAATSAGSASGKADTAAKKANEAASAADTAANKANAAAERVDTAIHKANMAAANADAKATAANTAAGKAEKAAADADTATGKANTAANKANQAANRLSGVAIDVTMLPPSAEPTATVTQSDTQTNFSLGIPKSNLAYATFEVDANMDLLMHSPEGFDDIDFQLNNGVLEVIV